MIAPLCPIESTYVDTTPSLYFTSPAKTETIIKKLVFSNSSGAAAAYTLYLVPAGGSPDGSNQLKTNTLASGSSEAVFEAQNQTLMPGDMIYASASVANALNLRVSGFAAT